MSSSAAVDAAFQSPASRWPGLTSTKKDVKDILLDQNLPKPPRVRARYLAPTANVGLLEVLPLELLHMIFLQLDIRSLVHLRLANRRATQLVDSLPQLFDIIKHAHNAFRGILAIGAGSEITCRTLHEKLCTQLCEVCGDFGGYLYLLTCKRVCFLCLTFHDAFLPLTPQHASQRFCVPRRRLQDLPRMTTVPGVYTANCIEIKNPIVLIDYERARSAGIAFHGSAKAMEYALSRVRAQRLDAYSDRMDAYRSSGGSGRRPRRPLLIPEQQFMLDPHRFAAISRVPWLHEQRAELGFHCVRCRKQKCVPQRHIWRMFSADLFEQHLVEQGGN